MSVVVTIKRGGSKPPITAEDVRRLVEQDSSLSGGEREPIIWTDPASGEKRYIGTVNPETGELETDDMRGDEESICRFLDKLRGVAGLWMLAAQQTGCSEPRDASRFAVVHHWRGVTDPEPA